MARCSERTGPNQSNESSDREVEPLKFLKFYANFEYEEKNKLPHCESRRAGPLVSTYLHREPMLLARRILIGCRWEEVLKLASTPARPCAARTFLSATAHCHIKSLCSLVVDD